MKATYKDLEHEIGDSLVDFAVECELTDFDDGIETGIDVAPIKVTVIRETDEEGDLRIGGNGQALVDAWWQEWRSGGEIARALDEWGADFWPLEED